MAKRKRKPAPALTYLGNRATLLVHVAEYAADACDIEGIVQREVFTDMDDALAAGFSGCAFCMSTMQEVEAGK